MKDEFFAFNKTLSKDELVQQINKFMRWYNYERLQLTLNGMTQNEYRVATNHFGGRGALVVSDSIGNAGGYGANHHLR